MVSCSLATGCLAGFKSTSSGLFPGKNREGVFFFFFYLYIYIIFTTDGAGLPVNGSAMYRLHRAISSLSSLYFLTVIMASGGTVMSQLQ